MNKNTYTKVVSLFFFFIFIVSFVLFLYKKINLIFFLITLELFLISVTIFCYFVLKEIKDKFVILYKIRWFFLIIIDLLILFAILGSIHNDSPNL